MVINRIELQQYRRLSAATISIRNDEPRDLSISKAIFTLKEAHFVVVFWQASKHTLIRSKKYMYSNSHIFAF